jgi:ABC-type proline/glycine betaine transport system permease subunit
MKFLLGVLVGYILRGKQKLLIRFLVTLALVVYVVIPAIALLGLSIDVQRERGLDQFKLRCRCSKD